MFSNLTKLRDCEYDVYTGPLLSRFYVSTGGIYIITDGFHVLSSLLYIFDIKRPKRTLEML